MNYNLDEIVQKRYRLGKGASYKFKFEMDGKDYIYKENMATVDGYEEVSDIGEVFSSYFLGKIGGLNYVNYEFATYKGKNGCISPSFIDDSVKYQKTFFDIVTLNYYQKTGDIDYNLDYHFKNDEYENVEAELWESNLGPQTNSMEFIIEQVHELCKNNRIILDKEKLEKEINTLVILDYFMYNVDRNMCNIEFLIKEKNGKLHCELAPIFDNGLSFGIRKYKSEEKLIESIGELNNSYVNCLGITKAGQELENMHDHRLLGDGGNIIADIMRLCNEDEYYKTLVDKCKKMDIRKLLDELEVDKDVELPEALKTIMCHSYGLRCARYDEVERKINKRVEKSQERQI